MGNGNTHLATVGMVIAQYTDLLAEKATSVCSPLADPCVLSQIFNLVAVWYATISITTPTGMH